MIKNDKRKKFLKELKLFGKENKIPNISKKNAQFLHFLVKNTPTKNILEIGTANGYSTIILADAIEEKQGNITTYEISQVNIDLAKSNFIKTKVDHLINFQDKNFLDYPPAINTKFDLIFVDAQKSHYHLFWEQIKNNIHSKTIIIFDDMIKFPAKTNKFKKILIKEKSFHHFMLPIDQDDGIFIIQKKEVE